MAPRYERVPTADEGPPSSPTTETEATEKASLAPRSRRGRFILLSLFAVVLLVAVYRFWFCEAQSNTDRGELDSPSPSEESKQGDTVGGGKGNQVPTNPSMPNGKLSVGYFVNWGIYGRKFPPQKIPAEDLTHILYAFADVRPDSGIVHLTDVWSDKDIHYPGDSWDESGENLYGNFKAIFKLKQQNRHLKTMMSIGGWTYSPHFHPVVVNPLSRRNFVLTSVQMMEDLGLDGIDIDYEYPSNKYQANGYVMLLKEMREALDLHAQTKGNGYRYLLTIAAPCGPDNYKKLDIAAMDPYLDFWNLMAYDYAGSWDSIANHQANLYGPPINSNDAVQYYISNGVARHKIILGIPLYGRSFMNTKGPGQPFQGIGPGSWEAGVYDYRALPLPGSFVLRDEKDMASWSINYQTGEMISFDNEEVGQWKGQWIKDQGLGGSMFWELSGDKNGDRENMETGPGKDPQPGRSLVKVVKDAMGELDTTPNWLQYTSSRFENMRNGMQ